MNIVNIFPSHLLTLNLILAFLMNQLQSSEIISDAFLNLKRPLIFFDLETTGTDSQRDHIVEISAIKLNIDQSQSRLHYVLNPQIPIPQGATKIHGFTDEDVSDKPSFCDTANEIYSFFSNCDLGGFNVKKFDIPLLMEEFHRCKMYPILLTDTKVVDVLSVYHKKEPRDLSAAVRFYCKEELDKAHSAQADVEATIKVFRCQLQSYTDLQPDVHSLHTFSCDGEHSIDFSGKFIRNEEGRIVFNFGKHKNRIVDLDDPQIADYFNWLTEKSNPSVEMRMAAKRVKTHHNCHKACMDWLQSKGLLASAEILKSLNEALTLEKDIYPFSVSRDGKKLTVIFHHSQGPALLLCSEDDKLTTLFILQHSLSKANPAGSVKNMATAEESV